MFRRRGRGNYAPDEEEEELKRALKLSLEEEKKRKMDAIQREKPIGFKIVDFSDWTGPAASTQSPSTVAVSVQTVNPSSSSDRSDRRGRGGSRRGRFGRATFVDVLPSNDFSIAMSESTTRRQLISQTFSSRIGRQSRESRSAEPADGDDGDDDIDDESEDDNGSSDDSDFCGDSDDEQPDASRINDLIQSMTRVEEKALDEPSQPMSQSGRFTLDGFNIGAVHRSTRYSNQNSSQLVILCVAEKPSIASSLATAFASSPSAIRTRSGRGTPVHEISSQWCGLPCTLRITSVTGHVFETDFAPGFDSWHRQSDEAMWRQSTEQLFHAPIVKKPSAQNGARICGHLQDESRGCSLLQLWLDCDKEGENIAHQVMDLTVGNLMKFGGLNQRVFRARFSSLAAQDLRSAFRDLERGGPNTLPSLSLSLSVDARQELDLKMVCNVIDSIHPFSHRDFCFARMFFCWGRVWLSPDISRCICCLGTVCNCYRQLNLQQQQQRHQHWSPRYQRLRRISSAMAHVRCPPWRSAVSVLMRSTHFSDSRIMCRDSI